MPNEYNKKISIFLIIIIYLGYNYIWTCACVQVASFTCIMRVHVHEPILIAFKEIILSIYVNICQYAHLHCSYLLYVCRTCALRL